MLKCSAGSYSFWISKSFWKYSYRESGSHERRSDRSRTESKDFIKDCQMGYDTRIGEMGMKLWEGEKTKDFHCQNDTEKCPYSYTGWSTAAVDSENEKLISEAIDDLSKNKTVITIAHHLNTIRNSTIVMDKRACSSDTGRHEELMKRCDFYREMVEALKTRSTWNLKEVITENV